MTGSTRREALLGLLASALLPAAVSGCGAGQASETTRTLLPPTAGELDSFLTRCIRCFRCGEVCTAGCIEFHPWWGSARLAGTPYIVPRQVGCNTCMACTQVCPTGALTAVEREDRALVLDAVHMGTAYVDEGLCLSHQGRACGVCHDACPYPTDAIKLGPHATPEVQQGCVGCGRCEERCPQVPAAIRVFPAGMDDPAAVGPRWTGPEVA